MVDSNRNGDGGCYLVVQLHQVKYLRGIIYPEIDVAIFLFLL